MAIWLDVGGSMVNCTFTHTLVLDPGTCVHTFAGFAHLYIPRFRAQVRVYALWQFALVHISRFEAQVRVYTPRQFALVDIPIFPGPAQCIHTLGICTCAHTSCRGAGKCIHTMANCTRREVTQKLSDLEGSVSRGPRTPGARGEAARGHSKTE